MASELQLETEAAASWPAELGRRLVTGLLGLAFLAAVLVSLVTTEPRSTGEAPATITGGLSEARSLRVAVEDVLGAAAQAELLRVAGTNGTNDTEGSELDRTAAALEDAWQSLAVAQAHLEAQTEVAAGTRPPLMNGAPPAPALARKDDGLVRSAMTYVRAALDSRDLIAVARARELLEMAKV